MTNASRRRTCGGNKARRGHFDEVALSGDRPPNLQVESFDRGGPVIYRLGGSALACTILSRNTITAGMGGTDVRGGKTSLASVWTLANTTSGCLPPATVWL